jgi:hypothetical protein
MDKSSSHPTFRPKTKVMIQLKWWQSLLLKSPARIRKAIADRLLSRLVQPELDVKFKMAETKEEFEQAFSLLHKYYVQKKMTGTFSSGVYLTLYHALPQTQMLIAVHQEKVIATLSLIRQSPIGLPIEKNFCLKAFSSLDGLGEVSDLALETEFQDRAATVLLPLFHFLVQVACRLNLSKLVTQFESRWLGLNKAILDFVDFKIFQPKSDGRSYGILIDLASFQNSSAPGVGRWPQWMKSFEMRMQIPDDKKLASPHPTMSPECMEYFFLRQTPVFRKLNDFEKLIFREIFQTKEYLRLIPKPKVLELKPRRQIRYPSRCSGILHLHNDRTIRFDIQNVSHNGIGGMMNAALPIGGYDLELKLPSGESCLLKGQLMWQTVQGHFGFSIDSPPAPWLEFIQDLQTTAESSNTPNHKIGA